MAELMDSGQGRHHRRDGPEVDRGLRRGFSAGLSTAIQQQQHHARRNGNIGAGCRQTAAGCPDAATENRTPRRHTGRGPADCPARRPGSGQSPSPPAALVARQAITATTALITASTRHQQIAASIAVLGKQAEGDTAIPGRAEIGQAGNQDAALQRRIHQNALEDDVRGQASAAARPTASARRFNGPRPSCRRRGLRPPAARKSPPPAARAFSITVGDQLARPWRLPCPAPRRSVRHAPAAAWWP